MSQFKNGEYSVESLQKCIPMVLNNELHFQRCVSYFLEEHNFIVNQEHFRKKLMKYLEESFRTDPVRLAQRLIRGQSTESGEESWIWLGGIDVSKIVIHSIK